MYVGLVVFRLVSDIRSKSQPNSILSEHEDPTPLEDLTRVVIKADSEYLVKGMTTRVFKWKENGFLTSRNTPVVNADLFKAIDQEIETLNKNGVGVQFWHVPRDQNTMADYLASCKLDNISAGAAIDAYFEEDE